MTPLVGSIVVMGVEGSGKTTVGAELARRLDVPFIEGDDLQPPDNVRQMAAGHPLTDEQRLPWLRAVGEQLARHATGVVASCSALKRAYRDLLRVYDPGAYFVFLSGSAELIASRIATRHHAYMPGTLLASQFAILEPLEPDERGMVIDVALPPNTIVETVLRSLAIPGG